MSRFLTRFWRPSTRPAPSRKAGRRTRPGIELLEDRQVPTVTFGGGSVLTHVEVQALYYGQDWATDPGLAATRGQLDAFLQYTVDSPYMDMLAGAGYHDAAGNLVGRGTFTQGRVDPTALNKAVTQTDALINTEVQQQIGNGTLAAQDANRLYVVFVEPNVVVSNSSGTSTNTFSGYHAGRWWTDGAGRVTSVLNYAVIPYPGGTVGNLKNTSLTDFQSMTEIVTHELAEAVTDPAPGPGWVDAAYAAAHPGDGGEIGDIVERLPNRTVFLNGYAVQKMADQNDNPIMPAGATLSPGPTAPTLTGPVGAITGQAPTFTWTASTGATSYQVRLDGQVVADGVAGTSWTSPSRLAAGTHTASVRAFSAGSQLFSDWGPAFPFGVTSSAPAAPAGLTQVGTATDAAPAVFTWQASAGATGYVLTVNAPGQPPLQVPAGPAAASVSATLPTLPAGTYTVTVVATNAFGESSGPAQAALTVTSSAPAPPAVPTQLAVAGGTADTPPTFSWQAGAGATSSELVVTAADQTVVQDVILTPANVTVANGQVSYTPGAPLAPGNYTFTVAAINDTNGTRSAPSAPLAFTVASPAPPAVPDVPTQLAAAGGTADTPPTFSWQASAGATSYELVVTAADQTVVQDVILTPDSGAVAGGTLFFTPDTPLPSGDYSFIVVAINDPNGTFSNPSAPFAFTIA
jgi:hypothetical protein